MNTWIETLNRAGEWWVAFAGSMLWQSSLVIVVLGSLNVCLRQRVSAVVRYGFSLLILVKLVLPPTLAVPTGIGYWVKREPVAPVVVEHPVKTTVTYGETSQRPARPVEVEPVRRVPLRWFASVSLIVVAVSGGLLWLLFKGARSVRRLVTLAAPATETWQQWLNETAAQLGIRRTVGLKITAQAMSPAVCGLWRPVILVPEKLMQELTEPQLRAAILHELIHLKRGDLWANYVQTLLQIIYWWHPLLWLANRQIRGLREQAVDEQVMAFLADDQIVYPETLLQVARHCFTRPIASLGMVGIIESSGALKERVHRLVSWPQPRRTKLGVIGVMAIIISGVLLLPMAQGKAGGPGFVGAYKMVPLEVSFYEVTTADLRQLPGSVFEKSGGFQIQTIGANDVQALIQKAKGLPDFEHLAHHDFCGAYFTGGTFTYQTGVTNQTCVNFQTVQTNGEMRIIGAKIYPPTLLNSTIQRGREISAEVFKSKRVETLSLIPQRAKGEVTLQVNWQPGRAGSAFHGEVKYPESGGAILVGPQDAESGKQPVIVLLPGCIHSQTEAANDARIPWQAWNSEAMQQARQAGKIVLVEVTADWSATSQINRKTSLEVPAVIEKMNELGVVAFLVDYTQANPEADALLRKFGRAGVPLTLVLPADARETAIVLPELLSPEMVVAALEKARTTPVKKIESEARAVEPVSSKTTESLPNEVAGKSLQVTIDAKSLELLLEAYNNQGSGKSLSASTNGNVVTLHANARKPEVKPKVFFLGETRGVLNLVPGETKTLSQAIVQLGYSESADLKKVELSRTDPDTGVILSVQRIDVDAVLNKRDPTKDAVLLAGDRVKVPRKMVASDPLQVLIESRLVELSQNAYRKLNLGKPFAVLTNGANAWLLPAQEAKGFFTLVDKTPEVDLLSAPRIITVNKQWARVEVSETVKIIDEAGQSKEISTGPSLEVVPVVSDDLRSISLSVNSVVTEFLGYEKSGPASSPIVRKRQCVFDSLVPNGFVLVLGGGQKELLSVGQIEKESEAKKRLLVCITPSLITATGNAYREP